MGLFLRAGLLMCRRVRHLDTRLPERPMVRLSPSAVMDGGMWFQLACSVLKGGLSQRVIQQ